MIFTESSIKDFVSDELGQVAHVIKRGVVQFTVQWEPTYFTYKFIIGITEPDVFNMTKLVVQCDGRLYNSSYENELADFIDYVTRRRFITDVEIGCFWVDDSLVFRSFINVDNNGVYDNRWLGQYINKLLHATAAMDADFCTEHGIPFNEKPLPKPVPQDSDEDDCFITTAVCNSLLKGDDCYELNVFRNFRDVWLKKQSDGLSLIREYYLIAPQIVRNINEQPDSRKIYSDIWDKYLVECLKLLQNKKYNECKNVYISMVRDLKRKYF